MGTRAGGGRPGSGASSLQVTPAPGGGGGGAPVGSAAAAGAEYPDLVYSGSDQDSDSGDEGEETPGSGGERRGVKRERSERELGHSGAQSSGALGGGGAYGGVAPGVAGAKPGKKTRGRVKIKMEFIDNKLRRYTTFSKRKTGIMKKVSMGCMQHVDLFLNNVFLSLNITVYDYMYYIFDVISINVHSRMAGMQILL